MYIYFSILRMQGHVMMSWA